MFTLGIDKYEKGVAGNAAVVMGLVKHFPRRAPFRSEATAIHYEVFGTEKASKAKLELKVGKPGTGIRCLEFLV